MSEKEYIIFCDESEQEGRFYSTFFGGVIVGASQYERVTRTLDAVKHAQHLFGEIKWEKVTERYLLKYQEVGVIRGRSCDLTIRSWTPP